MKAIVVAFTILACVGFSLAAEKYDKLHCEHKKPDIPSDWIDMADPCTKKMMDHVQNELNAAIQYMAMGAHFSRDTVNRPGFANLFFEAASEERQHAMKLISYLLMRGKLTDKINNLIKKAIIPEVTEWKTGIDALKNALSLEARVTKQIRSVIAECEENNTNFNDYHLVDYLTGDFLEEQYNGQRDLAGKVSTLQKMMDEHGALGEYLFDQQLLG